MLAQLSWQASLLGVLSLTCFAHGQNQTTEHEFNARRTVSIGYVLFPGFEPLDVYGPLQILFTMSAFYKMSLSLIASEVGPVNARMTQHRTNSSGPLFDWGYTLGPSTTATHTFLDAPALDIIFVPGGMGAVTLEQNNNTEIETFLNRRLRNAEYILGVSTGALTLARSGLLAGKRATTNKSSWAYVTDPKFGANITWVPSARWIEDGKVWTSSGVAAGLDMTYAFLKQYYGPETLDLIMNIIEYAPHQDPNWDPYSVVHNVPGADTNRPLSDCVAPVNGSTA